MAAPIWQYVVLMICFGLGFLTTLIAILGLAVMPKKDLPKKYDEVGYGSISWTILASAFGAYLSYSLYVWSPGLLGLALIAFHYTGLITSFVQKIRMSGKTIEYDKAWGTIAYGAVCTTVLLGLGIAYGIVCL